MSALEPTDWQSANQRYLVASVAAVAKALDRYAAHVRDDDATGGTLPDEPLGRAGAAPEAVPEPAWDLATPPALARICSAFGLSPFERSVLLLCAGIELDSRFAACCAAAQGDSQRAYPTFGLALAALPSAHWSALSPARPLRRGHLIELLAGQSVTTSPLRVDERVLQHLTGAPAYLDERLAGVVRPLQLVAPIAASQRRIAEQITHVWEDAVRAGELPIIQLCAEDAAARQMVALAACEHVGLHLYITEPAALPRAPGELELFKRLWAREVVLSQAALLIDCEEHDPSDAAQASLLSRLLADVRGPVLLASRERARLTARRTITFEVPRLSATEQKAIWQRALGASRAQLNGHVDALVAQFSLSAAAITTAATEALERGEQHDTQHDTQHLGELLWEACRAQARPRLEDLAQRIEPIAGWDALVLPEPQLRTLREVAAHVRQRARVYEEWGFATTGPRGLGISALFAGASGTGKTLSAEVLAHALRLDLYRIDLSSVVSKYIGETEKNLRRVFDAAELGGAILLFDEADALFGKRSEVKDSHDRYANIEVSYLLQRMEAYRGLAILTTNLKSALDPAFLRRIRFIVQFPFPDVGQRAEIWRRIFPQAVPTAELDIGQLARLNVAGGTIRNIALNAAFLAADAGEPVSMAHLLRAARTEYAKLEKTLTEAELAGWP